MTFPVDREASHRALGVPDLNQTSHDIEATAKQIAHIAIELNGVAHDLDGDPEALRLRAVGLQAEASQLAIAALRTQAAAEQIACAARHGGFRP